MINAENLEAVRNFLRENKSQIISEYDAAGAGIGKNHLNSREYTIVVYLKNAQNMPEKTVSKEGISLQFEVTGPFDLHT